MSKRQTNVLKLVCLDKSEICDAYARSQELAKKRQNLIKILTF